MFTQYPLIGTGEGACLQDEVVDLSSGADTESKDAHCKHYSSCCTIMCNNVLMIILCR